MPQIFWANNSEEIGIAFKTRNPGYYFGLLPDPSLILRTTLLNFMPLSAFFYLQKNLLRMKVFVISEFCVCTFSVYFRSFVLVLKVGKTQWCNILGHDENFYLLLLTGLDIVWSKIMGDTEAEIPKKIEVGNCATSRKIYFSKGE